MKEGQNRRRRGRNLSSITSDRINLDKCKENVIFFAGRRAGIIAAEYIVLWRYVLDDSGTGINGSLFKVLKER